MTHALSRHHVTTSSNDFDDVEFVSLEEHEDELANILKHYELMLTRKLKILEARLFPPNTAACSVVPVVPRLSLSQSAGQRQDLVSNRTSLPNDAAITIRGAPPAGVVVTPRRRPVTPPGATQAFRQVAPPPAICVQPPSSAHVGRRRSTLKSTDAASSTGFAIPDIAVEDTTSASRRRQATAAAAATTGDSNSAAMEASMMMGTSLWADGGSGQPLRRQRSLLFGQQAPAMQATPDPNRVVARTVDPKEVVVALREAQGLKLAIQQRQTDLAKLERRVSSANLHGWATGGGGGAPAAGPPGRGAAPPPGITSHPLNAGGGHPMTAREPSRITGAAAGDGTTATSRTVGGDFVGGGGGGGMFLGATSPFGDMVEEMPSRRVSVVGFFPSLAVDSVQTPRSTHGAVVADAPAGSASPLSLAAGQLPAAVPTHLSLTSSSMSEGSLSVPVDAVGLSMPGMSSASSESHLLLNRHHTPLGLPPRSPQAADDAGTPVPAESTLAPIASWPSAQRRLVALSDRESAVGFFGLDTRDAELSEATRLLDDLRSQLNKISDRRSDTVKGARRFLQRGEILIANIKSDRSSVAELLSKVQKRLRREKGDLLMRLDTLTKGADTMEKAVIAASQAALKEYHRLKRLSDALASPKSRGPDSSADFDGSVDDGDAALVDVEGGDLGPLGSKSTGVQCILIEGSFAKGQRLAEQLAKSEAEVRRLLPQLGQVVTDVGVLSRVVDHDLCCVACGTNASEDFQTLWPCGHTHCLSCTQHGGNGLGSYSCPTCGTRTTDAPTTNHAVNLLVSRFHFSKSGFGNILDGFTNLNSSLSIMDEAFASQYGGLYRFLPKEFDVDVSSLASSTTSKQERAQTTSTRQTRTVSSSQN